MTKAVLEKPASLWKHLIADSACERFPGSNCTVAWSAIWVEYRAKNSARVVLVEDFSTSARLRAANTRAAPLCSGFRLVR